MLDALVVGVPLGGETVLGAQQNEDEDREARLHDMGEVFNSSSVLD